MTITADYDPTGYLDDPILSTGSFMWEVRMSAGALVGAVDAGLYLLINFSPLEEWLVKPIGGGWDAVDAAGQAWENLGKAVSKTASNLASVPGQVGDRWTGEAATTFAAANEKIADALQRFPEGCAALAEACATLAEVAKLAATTIATIIGELVDLVITILTLLAGVFSSPAAAAPTAVLGAKIPLWVTKVATAIQKIIKVIQTIAKITGPLLTIAGQYATLEEAKVNAARSIKNSTDTANEAFAV